MKRPFYHLAIESSCDETAAAVFQGGALISEKVASQEALHMPWGGVVPEVASRAHQTQIVPVVESALAQAGITSRELGAIAVTQGPGLLGALLIGLTFAKGLAVAHQLPLLGIHHLEAHILANFLHPPFPVLPCLGLVVSGGHTHLLEVRDPLTMRVLGSTQDDAIGEAFDKIAKVMGFPYPGGRHIDAQARQGDPHRFLFPKAKVGGLDFSFSGIKTAFRYFLAKHQQAEETFVRDHLADLCASVQARLVGMVIDKVASAIQATGLTSLAVGGGVACNSHLRTALEQLISQQGGALFIPPASHCTDNAAMIGVAAHYQLLAGRKGDLGLAPEPQMAMGWRAN